VSLVRHSGVLICLSLAQTSGPLGLRGTLGTASRDAADCHPRTVSEVRGKLASVVVTPIRSLDSFDGSYPSRKPSEVKTTPRVRGRLVSDQGLEFRGQDTPRSPRDGSYPIGIGVPWSSCIQCAGPMKEPRFSASNAHHVCTQQQALTIRPGSLRD
jgi:hypothetical protein